MSDRVTLVGTGPRRVVAAHGWLGDAASWSALWPHLDTESFSYACVDARGYGAARDLTGEFTMAGIAADLLATADELGWPEFALLGHSMGGMAIQLAALAAPHRVSCLVGLAPVPAGGTPMSGARAALFDAAVHDVAARERVIDASTGGRLGHTWLRATARDSMRAAPAAVAGYLRSWTGDDFHHRITGATVPVLVVHGGHDPGCTAERVADTWGRWYADLDVACVADAGHYPMAEAPVLTAALIERFVAAHASQPEPTTSTRHQEV